MYSTGNGYVSIPHRLFNRRGLGYQSGMDGHFESVDGMKLLDEVDGAPFDLLRPDAGSRAILVCDHASNRIPARLGDLGLARDIIEDHVGWDIGAEAVTRILSEKLDATAIICGFSRLVIDCNRPPGSPASIPETSDGYLVPGNQALSRAERAAREREILEPYHGAISREVAGRWQDGLPPALVSIHSFTPALKADGRPRPWQICILWGHDGRIAQPLMENLALKPEITVGDNVPYSGLHVAYTVNIHGHAAGLPHVGIEIRQDLIATQEGAAHWAGILQEALAPVLANHHLYQARHF